MVLRKCVGCGQIKERSNLIRLMKDYKSHEILIAPNSKHFGYSVYLCYNSECLKNALKKKRISKVLRQEISKETMEDLEVIINN